MARRRAALLLILVLMSGSLAGCLGGDTPIETELDADAQPETTLDANESTSAPDGRGDLAAFKETNRTEAGTGGMEHGHDYWQGRERIVLYQDDLGLIPLPLIPEGKAPGTAIADFDLPEPVLVYEGTKQVELLFSDVRPLSPSGMGVPAHPHVTIFVDYLTAADEPGAFRPAGQVTPDVPLVLTLKPTEADMPHQQKSLWVFRIYTGEVNAWSFNLSVTAVKGYDVVKWPPHPDLYADKPDRVILDGSFTTSDPGDVTQWVDGKDANWIYPDRVISYGTDKLEVTVQAGAFSTATTAEPRAFVLEYNNASYISKMGNGDEAGGRITLDPNPDGTYTFEIDLTKDAQAYDTPYGIQSRWAFRFVARCQTCGVVPYELDYAMTIVAYGHSTAAGETGDPNAPAPPTPPTPP